MPKALFLGCALKSPGSQPASSAASELGRASDLPFSGSPQGHTDGNEEADGAGGSILYMRVVTCEGDLVIVRDGKKCHWKPIIYPHDNGM